MLKYLKADHEKFEADCSEESDDKGFLIIGSMLGRLKVLDIINPSSDEVELKIIK